MSGRRFNNILKTLTFSSNTALPFKDKFWEIQQLIKAWNDHMIETFVPSWISYLDESMSPWSNKFTCPGLIFCPRKPHPKGNKYHLIACGLSQIIYQIDIREGKDHPKEVKLTFSEFSLIVNLFLRLYIGIYGTDKTVILDSVFCILRGLIVFKKQGVFVSALIKKRKYWPKFIKGDNVNKYFEGNKIGEYDRLNGKLNGVYFSLLVMKELEYNMMLISTYSFLQILSAATEKNIIVDNVTTKFRYKEPFLKYFNYRDIVNNYNALCYSYRCDLTLGIEHTFKTHCWAICVFCFIIELIEVNVFLDYRYFLNIEEEFLEFRKL